MRISQVTNFYPTNVLPKKNFRANRNSVMSSKCTPSQSGKISFTGNKIYLTGKLQYINDKKFPDELYLDLDKVFETLENEDETYNRWERFQFVLTGLAAKRCNHLGITKGAIGSGIGFCDRKISMTIHELKNKEYPKRLELDWADEYNELETFFKGPNGPNGFWGAEDDMEAIKAGLSKILKKQGWIK